MPSVEYDATAPEVRHFVLLQMALTAVFCLILFFVLGGIDKADLPPLWLSAILVVAVGIGAVLSERVWLTASPLPPDGDPERLRREAIGVFAGQTVRKLMYCDAPLLLAAIVAFVTDHGAWPLVIAGVPGLLVLAWEVWPTLRNTSLCAGMLDAQGADSRLVQSFLA